MPVLVIPYPHYCAPPSYNFITGFGLYSDVMNRGHVPFDIEIFSMAARAYPLPLNFPPNGRPKIALQINGSTVTPILQPDPRTGESLRVSLDPPLSVPRVSLSNVDGAGTLNFDDLLLDSITDMAGTGVSVALGYRTTLLPDAGKQILAIGATVFAQGGMSISPTLYGPLQFNFSGDIGGWSSSDGNGDVGNGSTVFVSAYELRDDTPVARFPTYPGDVSPTITSTFPIPVVLDDFVVVSHHAGGAPGTYSFGLRVDGVTVKNFTIFPGDRLSYPADSTPLDIHAGSRVNTILLGASGGTLDAEFLCSLRPGTSFDPGWMAGGAFAGGYSG